MPLLQWSPEYSVNIAAIDEEHRQLFAIVNELYDAMQGGCGKSVLSDVLERLTSYAGSHFANEEALFRQHGYPNAAEHRAQHAALTVRTSILKRRCDSGEIGVTADALGFLVDWLHGHVLSADLDYGEFLSARGVH